MEKLSMCRICLVEGVRMYGIGSSQLRKTYEALTSSPFETGDGRPLQVCYICYAILKKCHRLKEYCIRSEKLLTQMINNNMLKIKPVKSSHHGLTIGPVIHTRVGFDSHEINQQKAEGAALNHVKHISETDSQSLINVSWMKKEPADAITTVQNEHTDSINDNHNEHKTQYINIELIKEEPQDTSESDTESPIDETENILVQPDVSWIKKEQENDWLNESNAKNTDHQHTLPHSVSGKPVQLVKNDANNVSRKSENSEIVNLKPGSFKETQPVLSNTALGTPCTKKRPFGCYACHKTFTRKEYLRSHLCLNVRGPYKCDICEKGFNRKDILNKHILIHSGEKPYQCDICKKSFQQKSYLNTHIRTHTGENPYPCSVCHKVFNSTSNLKRHFRTHTGEKPHQCEICDKGFICKGDLIKHNRKHTGEKPFQCEICKKYFSTNAYVKKHYIRAHSAEAISM